MKPLLLSIQKLSKTYRSRTGKHKREALKGVSLDIKRGEIIALLGVNGAGKTTLSSILATLYTRSGGEILWEGRSIYQNLISYRRRVGLCPQHPNIPNSLSLDEVLLFSGRCYGLTREEAIEQRESLCNDLCLNAYRKERAIQLSGGYRQRFLIARALMHSPDLVILDEPTVGLDPHIRRALWDVIAKLRDNGKTVLLTTHYLDEAEVLADRVSLIHDGEIKDTDTPAHLIEKHGKENLEEVFIKFVGEQNEVQDVV
ncbi:MAG: ABC transporter ATP-binding protein [Chlamydiales bacterium]